MPCARCTACCRSSQFIHIAPEETETIARIPEELLFAAPGLPAGNVLLGYDEHGHCPMLAEDACSIYEHRPLTCRSYDCRVFAATGVAPASADGSPVAKHARRWQFSHPTERDDREHAAVRAAGKFLTQREGTFGARVLPEGATQLAVLALKVHAVFAGCSDAPGSGRPTARDREVAAAVVEARDRFDTAREIGP